MRRRADPQALQDELWSAYYRAIDLIQINLLWFVFSALVIPAIPALGALFYATQRIARQGSAGWRDFWEGFRQHFWLSWRWGLINAGVLGLLGLTLAWYGQTQVRCLAAAQGVLIALGAGWIALNLFTFPLLLEQADQRFLVALRNSAVLWLRFPGLALGALLLIVIAAGLSVVIPPAWIVITASFCAYQASRAVVRAVQALTRGSTPS